MNRVECLPFLLVWRSVKSIVEQTLEMDSVVVVCGAVAAYVFYSMVRFVYRKRHVFQNYVDMIYFLEATSKIDADRCQKCFLKVGSMFGLLYAEYVQGSALRTWNCVARLASIVWYKFNHLRDPIMPRRRKHHSRSRSRSHSHDRDRDAKRRRVESYESPHHRRSVSSEPEEPIDTATPTTPPIDDTTENDERTTENDTTEESTNKTADNGNDTTVNTTIDLSDSDTSMVTAEESPVEIHLKTPKKTPLKVKDAQSEEAGKKLTPKQVERRKEAEKKRVERLEEKERRKEETSKLKKLKDEQKQKEKEVKLKEKEKILKEKEEKKKEKELKKKEKEEKEELKRKEKEQEKLEKQHKIEEKNKEKQRVEEAKLKAAAAFTKFFKKLPENQNDGNQNDVVVKGRIAFMPFEKKADMKLAPIVRKEISSDSKTSLDKLFKDQSTQCLYLQDLKAGKETGKSETTWPKQEESEDVVIIGETIEEEKHKIKKMRAKLLQFTENQRPGYYGTFRKKSNSVGPRNPFGKDEDLLDYEVDSDEEWEEEPEGESLKGTDDEEEDKENEGVNDDYEVDNEFFVPHGHLSDDEIDDEAERKLDPEMHKAKLKLLKNEFEEERKSKTQKLRSVIIGGYWQGKIKDTVSQHSINKYLAPYTFIRTDRKVDIKERSNLIVGGICNTGRKAKLLGSEHLPLFLKFVHGSSKKGKELIKKFIEQLEGTGIDVDASQMAMGKQLRKYAEWTNKEEGVKKRCWIVREQYQKKFNLDLTSKLDTCIKDLMSSSTP